MLQKSYKSNLSWHKRGHYSSFVPRNSCVAADFHLPWTRPSLQAVPSEFGATDGCEGEEEYQCCGRGWYLSGPDDFVVVSRAVVVMVDEGVR